MGTLMWIIGYEYVDSCGALCPAKCKVWVRQMKRSCKDFRGHQYAGPVILFFGGTPDEKLGFMCTALRECRITVLRQSGNKRDLNKPQAPIADDQVVSQFANR